MPITTNWFGNAMAGQYSATAARRVDWVTDTIKVSLHTVTYAPDQDAHTFFSSVTDEITGTNYVAGGATLGTKSVSYDSATNEVRLIAANAVWALATFTCRRGVIYKDTGVAATSPLLGWIDFGANETISTGTFTVIWDVTGVLKAAAA